MTEQRSTEEIVAHADELVQHFENWEPGGDGIDGASLRAVRVAAQEVTAAHRNLAELVDVARAEGHSWAAIGAMLGTFGEAAWQLYGRPGPTGEASHADP